MTMDKNFPLVTIGIPFLNPGEAFREAIRSVFAQSYSNWELILVNDGSKDNSLELAKRICDPRVRILSDGKKLGLAARLNQITNMARGQYIARMDADDIMFPDRIARQVAFLLTNPDVDVVGTGVFFLDIDGRPVGLRYMDKNVPKSLHESFRRPWLVHGTVMAKREWFVNNPYDSAFLRGEERELFLRAFNNTRFGFISEPLYGWRFVGAHSLDKYLKNFKYERRSLLKHGPKLLGWPETLARLLWSLSKSLIAVGLFATGAQGVVYQRAYKPISISMKKEFEKIINRIQQQSVPGW